MISHFPSGIRVEFLDSISLISKQEWNCISDPKSPFLEYDFLKSLEVSCCIGPSTSWIQRYCVLLERRASFGRNSSLSEIRFVRGIYL